MGEYLDVDAALAKKSISRIFGLGMPESDVPFLLSLASDLAQAAHLVLQMPDNRNLQGMFSDRAHPRATRFFYAVSKVEDELLTNVNNFIGNSGGRPSATLFDELYFQCPALPDFVEDAVADMCETLGYAFKVAKPQVTPAFGYVCFVLRRGTMRGALERYPGLQLCLYDSLRYIGWNSPSAAPSWGPHAVRDFNARQTCSRQCDSRVYYLRHADVSDMQTLLTMGAREFLCWQPHSEDGGHYFAVAILEDGMLSVMDSAIGQQIDMLPHEFRMAWLRVDRLVFFILELWPAGRLLAMDDEACDLAGGGARAQKLSSQFFAHVKAEVISPAFPIVESGVYTFGLWPTPPPHACVVREKRLGCRLDYLAMPLGGNRLIVGSCSGQIFLIVGSSVVSLRYLWALKLL